MPLDYLFTSFISIFLAALPGRTTFVLVLLASQGNLKKIVLGAAAAFLIQSMISVLLGALLVLLPQTPVHLITAILFIFFSYSFWRQSNKAIEFNVASSEISIKSTFFLVFMAEFGDVSQLAIATIASSSRSKLITLFAFHFGIMDDYDTRSHLGI